MADLVAADVTVTPQTVGKGKVYIAGNKRIVLVSIAFGDGAKTYPSGGVPMPSYTKFGLVRSLDYVTLVDSANAVGIVWKWDFSNKKLRGYRTKLHGHTLYVDTGATDATGARVNAATNSLAMNNAAASIASIATAATPGGIVQAPADVLVELASYAPAATTLYAEAVGW